MVVGKICYAHVVMKFDNDFPCLVGIKCRYCATLGNGCVVGSNASEHVSVVGRSAIKKLLPILYF